MSFSIAGPISYTLKRNWYVYTNSGLTAVAKFSKKESLRAWWRLDTDITASGAEGLDSSGYGHPLVATTDADRPSFDSGDTPSTKIQASSCLFDGTKFLKASDSNIGSTFSFGDGTSDSPFSISFWVQFKALSSTHYIVTKYNAASTAEEWVFTANSAGTLQLSLYDASATATARAYTAASTVVIGSWYHIVVNYSGKASLAASTNDNNGITLYVNGTSQSLTYVTQAYTAMEATTALVAVGNTEDESSGKGFIGNLADLAVLAAELSSTDISALYNAKTYTTFANYRNWSKKKSVATPGTRVSATYQGINIESAVSSSADTFALGILPFVHVQHKPTKFFRGTDQLFVNNFDDTVSIPIQTFVPRRELQKKAASITVIKHPARLARSAAAIAHNRQNAGGYSIPDSRGRNARIVSFEPDLTSTTHTLYPDDNRATYGIAVLSGSTLIDPAENDTPHIAKRLYNAINAAITVFPPMLQLNAHLNDGASTIYLTLKDTNALTGNEDFDSTSIRGTAVLGTIEDDNDGYAGPLAYVEDFSPNLSDQLPLPFGDTRDLDGIMTQEKYSTPLDLGSPKWSFGLGESPQYDDTGPFHDGGDFDPVFYLTYSGSSAMWPVNLVNAGLMQGRLFDGVLECFDIRREVTFDLDLRYDGRTIRGEVEGCFGSNYLGSTEIVSHERISDKKNAPFLDACELFAHAPATAAAATAAIKVISSDITVGYTPESNTTVILQDVTGFKVVFQAEQDYEQPARGDNQYIDAATQKRWFWQYGLSGVSSVSDIAERLTAAINQARSMGDIQITATQDTAQVNLTQDMPGEAGNTGITGLAVATSGVMAVVNNFIGGMSSMGLGAVTTTGAPAYGYFSTVNRFPVSDDGEVMANQAESSQPRMWYADELKTTTTWLPSKDIGTHYFLLKNNFVSPFIDRIYIEQFTQPIFVHNDDNSPTLDPIISAIMNLSSSIYPSVFDSDTNKWKHPEAPFKNDNWVGPRKGQFTPDMPQVYGCTGFYYSRKPDSIAFGDL